MTVRPSARREEHRGVGRRARQGGRHPPREGSAACHPGAACHTGHHTVPFYVPCMLYHGDYFLRVLPPAALPSAEGGAGGACGGLPGRAARRRCHGDRRWHEHPAGRTRPPHPLSAAYAIWLTILWALFVARAGTTARAGPSSRRRCSSSSQASVVRLPSKIPPTADVIKFQGCVEELTVAAWLRRPAGARLCRRLAHRARAPAVAAGQQAAGAGGRWGPVGESTKAISCHPQVGSCTLYKPEQNSNEGGDILICHHLSETTD